MTTLHVTIRPPKASDQAAFLAAARRSRRLHRPWMSPPSTPATVRKFLTRRRGQRHATFMICHGPDLVGVVNVSEIVRGAFQSGYLGYYAFAPFAGTGLMRAGLATVIAHAFTKMKLHRLEANIQPANRRSIRFAKSLGFRREGFSPRYLKIAGRWRDHQRWAILSR